MCGAYTILHLPTASGVKDFVDPGEGVGFSWARAETSLVRSFVAMLNAVGSSRLSIKFFFADAELRLKPKELSIWQASRRHPRTTNQLVFIFSWTQLYSKSRCERWSSTGKYWSLPLYNTLCYWSTCWLLTVRLLQNKSAIPHLHGGLLSGIQTKWGQMTCFK